MPVVIAPKSKDGVIPPLVLPEDFRALNWHDPVEQKVLLFITRHLGQQPREMICGRMLLLVKCLRSRFQTSEPANPKNNSKVRIIFRYNWLLRWGEMRQGFEKITCLALISASYKLFTLSEGWLIWDGMISRLWFTIRSLSFCTANLKWKIELKRKE